MTTNVAARQSFSLTKRPRDALTGPLFGFAIAGGPAIRGIAQHAPNGGSLPAAFAGSCRNLDRKTSELQSQSNLVCRLLLEKKKRGDLHTGTRVQDRGRCTARRP